MEGLSDGFRNKNAVNSAIQTFQSLVSSTKQVNEQIYKDFANKVSIE